MSNPDVLIVLIVINSLPILVIVHTRDGKVSPLKKTSSPLLYVSIYGDPGAYGGLSN